MRTASLVGLVAFFVGCGPRPTAEVEGLYRGRIEWGTTPCDRPAAFEAVLDEREWWIGADGSVTGASMCASSSLCVQGELELDVQGSTARVVGAPQRFSLPDGVFGEVEDVSGALYVSGPQMRGVIELRLLPDDGRCIELRGVVTLAR